jgi:hypothetical protein
MKNCIKLFIFSLLLCGAGVIVPAAADADGIDSGLILTRDSDGQGFVYVRTGDDYMTLTTYNGSRIMPMTVPTQKRHEEMLAEIMRLKQQNATEQEQNATKKQQIEALGHPINIRTIGAFALGAAAATAFCVGYFKVAGKLK